MGLVERTFPVKAERAGRAIGGASMGGFGAVKIGLKHHDRFASAHAHSGPLAVLRAEKGKQQTLPPDLRRVFGDKAFGGPDDPFAIVEKLDHGRLPALRIDCGTEDEFLDRTGRSTVIWSSAGGFMRRAIPRTGGAVSLTRSRAGWLGAGT